MAVRVQVLNEVSDPNPPGDWRLCFQWCRYIDLEQKEPYYGYRFIWRRPDGSLQAARGQARLMSIEHGRQLMARAEKEGWGHHEAEV